MGDGEWLKKEEKRKITLIYRDMVLSKIESCQAETMRVIGKAEEYVRENKITKGQIWCVYDKDSFPASDVNGVVQRQKY